MPQAPVFLINLDRSTDRLARSDMELQRLNIDYKRISAVEGSKLGEQALNQSKALDYSGYYKILSPAEIGCYLSHIKCWQLMVDQNIEQAVILEDDFALKPEFKEICSSLADIPGHWECLKLTEHPEKRLAIKQQAFKQWQVVIYDKAPSRTGAYAITLSGAKKMLAHSKLIARPVDIDIQYGWEHGMRVCGIKPYPVSVEVAGTSTIDAKGNRKKAEKSVWAQIAQSVGFKLNNYKYKKQRLNDPF